MNSNVHVFDEIPPGWKVLHGANTAPCGYELISNGESRFSPKYQIGLVKCDLPAPKGPETAIPAALGAKTVSPVPSEAKKRSGVCFSDEPGLPERMNRLAREEAKLKLQQDICRDMMVCQLEGWDYKEYLHELLETIRYFLN